MGGLLGIILSLIAGARSFKKWRETREDKNMMALQGIVTSFANTLNERFDHIDEQFEDQNKRLNRIDRNTGIDST